MGAFTAASNITGLCADVDAVTALLHDFGALAFWDYATAAPYIKVRAGGLCCVLGCVGMGWAWTARSLARSLAGGAAVI